MTESSTATGLAIDVFADVVCPWCYIGKKRLESELGVSGVPFFVFGGMYAVSGAQPESVLLKAIDRAERPPTPSRTPSPAHPDRAPQHHPPRHPRDR